MSQIYLAANWIGGTLPIGHLQVVYGGFEIEVQAPTDASGNFDQYGYWQYPDLRIHADQAT